MNWENLARPKPLPHGSPLYQRLIGSPLWVAQLKVDGWRVLVDVLRNGCIRLTTRHGEELSAPKDFAGSVLPGIPALTSLDCELERPWKKLWVFDVLTVAGADMTGRPLSERLVRLANVVQENDVTAIVPTTRERKDDYYNAVIEAGGEGIVLKRLCDPYPRGGVVWMKTKPELS